MEFSSVYYILWSVAFQYSFMSELLSVAFRTSWKIVALPEPGNVKVQCPCLLQLYSFTNLCLYPE